MVLIKSARIAKEIVRIGFLVISQHIRLIIAKIPHIRSGNVNLNR